MVMTLEERSQLSDFLIVEKWKTTTPQTYYKYVQTLIHALYTHTPQYRNQHMQACFEEK